MSGLTFEDLARAAPTEPNRADVACFIGFVARRPPDETTPVVPPAGFAGNAGDFPLYAWLDAAGWARRPYLPDPSGRSLYGGSLSVTAPPWTRGDAALESLLDLPVPVESWEAFDRLFAWEARPLLTAGAPEDEAAIPRGTTYLGAAVRSFFAQGGRRCYVVRVGDPWPLDAPESVRAPALGRLLPGLPGRLAPSRADRASWSGAGHLFGLPDVSFVCFPDLADAVSGDRAFPKPAPEPPAPAEVFVVCSAGESAAAADRFVRGFAAPRCTPDGYDRWAAALRAAGDFLREPRNGLREIQLLASVPLPARSPGEAPPDSDLLAWLARRNGWLDAASPDSFASAFVQLAWPWVKTPGSRQLPEELEGPDAVLVGVLARNALENGSFRSAAGLPLAEVHDIEPPLGGRDRALDESRDTLIQRVSLLGPTPGGMQVLSDVTTFPGESYRQGNVNRLVSAIARAARRLGEELTFDASGPALWARVRASLEALLTQLWRDGALRGRSEAEAFDVRCDRTTMSDRDLEDGRVLAEVSFEAALAIERIRVVLALAEGITSLARAA